MVKVGSNKNYWFSNNSNNSTVLSRKIWVSKKLVLIFFCDLIYYHTSPKRIQSYSLNLEYVDSSSTILIIKKDKTFTKN